MTSRRLRETPTLNIGSRDVHFTSVLHDIAWLDELCYPLGKLIQVSSKQVPRIIVN